MTKVINRLFVGLFSVLLLFIGCVKEDLPRPPEDRIVGDPVVTTADVTDITTSTAKCGGEVVMEKGNELSARGVCWSTSPNPTIEDNHTIDGEGKGSFESDISELTANVTYYVRAYATNEYGTGYGEEKSFTTLIDTTVGTLNGYTWVDLGLPSGLKWATCNVGATSPEDYGNYYAWGETTTKTEYTDENSTTCGQQIGDISGNPTYDAARANWGGTWRMPTKSEIEELVNSCTWDWTTQNGVRGMKVTGLNGRSIFLPAAGWREGSVLIGDMGDHGRYWSSTPDESSIEGAWYLGFILDYCDHEVNRYIGRRCGNTIRPVTD